MDFNRCLQRLDMMYSEKGFEVPQWYAIHTHPRQEDRATLNLQAWNVETFSPKLRERHYDRLTRRLTHLSKALFPRYIFARFQAGLLLHKIWFTRGVHSVVSFGDGPIAISDEIIELIQSQIGEDGLVGIGEDLKPGDLVMITDGPLKSLTGIFEREMKATDRVSILLTAVNYQGHILVEKGMVNKVNQSLLAAADC